MLFVAWAMAGCAGVCNSQDRWGIDCKRRWLEVISETQCNFSRASETSVQEGHFFLNNGDFRVLFLGSWLLFPLAESRGVCWSLSQLHPGERRVGPWVSCQLITRPYMSISGFGTLLIGTSAVLWRCPFVRNWGLNQEKKAFYFKHFYNLQSVLCYFLWLSICPLGICDLFTIGIPLSHQPYATSPSVPLPRPINTATEVTQALRNSWHAN